jgi:aspartyl-tRNA(Asn)/glutamyl-tRNA(Gln) amidotransferase subunit C
MSLTIEEVRRIALLARVRLRPEEEETLVSQLGAVVDYIDQLKEFSSATPQSTRRGLPEADDRSAASLDRGHFLRNAPATLDSFLMVPQVKGSDDE